MASLRYRKRRVRDLRSKCFSQSTGRGPKARSMSWLIQALRLGLALASISALGRRRRMAMTLSAMRIVYYADVRSATVFWKILPVF